jgi:hypothetical protein
MSCAAVASAPITSTVSSEIHHLRVNRQISVPTSAACGTWTINLYARHAGGLPFVVNTSGPYTYTYTYTYVYALSPLPASTWDERDSCHGASSSSTPSSWASPAPLAVKCASACCRWVFAAALSEGLVCGVTEGAQEGVNGRNLLAGRLSRTGPSPR